MKNKVATHDSVRQRLYTLWRCAGDHFSKLKLRLSKRKVPVCIFKTDGIGDFVLALGAIRLLVNSFGDENCALVIWPAALPLAEREFPKTIKIVVPPRLRGGFHAILGVLRLVVRLKTLRFEHLVCFRHQRSRFQCAVLHWVQAKSTYGITNDPDFFCGRKREFMFGSEGVYPIVAPKGFCLELEAHRQLAEQVLHRSVSIYELKPRIDGVDISAENYILVCPFSSAAIKDYPIEPLSTVIAAIYDKYGISISLSFSPEQFARAQELKKILREKGVNILPLSTNSFQEFLGRIARATAILTVDTATAHIATALDKRTVVILGGGHYATFGPWNNSQKQEWITNSLPCFYCNWECTEPEPFCITRIAPSRLVDAMIRVLGEKATISQCNTRDYCQ